MSRPHMDTQRSLHIDSALLEVGALLDRGAISRMEAMTLVHPFADLGLSGLQRASVDMLLSCDGKDIPSAWIRDSDVAKVLALIRDGRPTIPLMDGWAVPAELGKVLEPMAWFSGTLDEVSTVADRSTRVVWDGVGLGRCLLLQSPDGSLLSMGEYLEGSKGIELLADSPEAAQKFFDWAGLDRSDAVWVSESLEALPWERFEVWRQDDNGRKFLVSAHTSHRKAQCTSLELEKRGHKQTYWVTPF